MRIKTISILILLLLSFMPTAWAILGDIVFDPTVAAKIVDETVQITKQLDELQQQSAYLKQQLDALKQLSSGQYQWSNAQSLINQLGQTSNQTNALSYNAQNINDRFGQTFPGYRNSNDFSGDYQNIIKTTLQTLNSNLQTLGMSAQDFQNENARMSFLQAQSQNAVGQTQAIQASSQIASEQVSQLQLLRQTLIAQSNAQSVYYAAQVQQQADADSAFSQLVANGNKKFDGPWDGSPTKKPW